jgi:hypothetical protein
VSREFEAAVQWIGVSAALILLVSFEADPGAGRA